ncbi:MAG: glycosyltransferase [Pseudomonadota bacterium]
MELKVLHTEWSDGLGGQEMRILLEAKTIAALGHQVTILSRPGCRIVDQARETGLRVIETPMRESYDLPALFRLVMLFRRERFNVINTHSSVDSWLASAAAKLTRAPVLVRTRHLSVPVSDHFLNFVYRWPDGIVVTAEATRRRLIEVNRIDPERIATIPTGVDLNRFHPDLDPGDIRARLGLAPGLRVATMVAVLRSWKRHEVFLEAAAELAANRPELRFLVVGEGPRRPHIEEKIRELNLGQKVIMTGHRLDIPEILAISDVTALTSESSEGVPQSVLQYIRCTE